MAEIGSLVSELKQREGELHVLVNNAGTGWLETLDSLINIGSVSGICGALVTLRVKPLFIRLLAI